MDRREFAPVARPTTFFSTHAHTLRILRRILGVSPSEYQRNLSHFSASSRPFRKRLPVLAG
jgi:hypothetical protein